MKFYKGCDPERALQVLERATEPMKSDALAEALDVKRQRAVDVLTRLHAAGMVTRTKTRRGYAYTISAIAKKEPADAVEPESANVEVANSEIPGEPESPVSPVASEDDGGAWFDPGP